MKLKQISVFVLTLLAISLVSMAIGSAGTPQFNQNITNTSTPTTYNFTNAYSFQVNITKPTATNMSHVNVSYVWFESNHTGTKTNYTATNATATAGGGIWWYNLTNPGAMLINYTWFANDTDNAWNKTAVYNFEITKATPSVISWVRNDSYINMNQSVRVELNLTGGATVRIQIQKPKGTTVTNHTATWRAGTQNYTFDFSKTEIGDIQANITEWLNITAIYVGGTNYTEAKNTTTLFNFSYGSTNAITATHTPDPVTDGSSLTINSNFTTTEFGKGTGTIVWDNCSISIYGSTYYMSFSSGQQTRSFGATPSSPGNYFTYNVSCVNTSYQTQSVTGTVFIAVGGGSDGGGGGGRVVATTTRPVVAPICGDGICETGESFWNCMKDCPLFTTGQPSVGETTTIPETPQTTTPTISTGLIVLIIVLGWLFLKKR